LESSREEKRKENQMSLLVGMCVCVRECVRGEKEPGKYLIGRSSQGERHFGWRKRNDVGDTKTDILPSEKEKNPLTWFWFWFSFGGIPVCILSTEVYRVYACYSMAWHERTKFPDMSTCIQ